MRIEILSPDGFSIDMQVHTSMKQANIALNNLKDLNGKAITPQ